MKHLCHARNCDKECKPEKLMCGKHWAMVPAHIQKAVYKNFRAGQIYDQKPSEEWMAAADAAIRAVSAAETKAQESVNQTSMFSILGEPPVIDKKGGGLH